MAGEDLFQNQRAPWLTLDPTANASVTTPPDAADWRLFIDTDLVVKLKDDAGNVYPLGATRNNFSGTAAPTANEDTNDGYRVGSIWIDTTNDKAYICLDATAATAVWTEVTQGGATGTTVATDTIWDAAGDLVQGTGANTGARLALGSAGSRLKVGSSTVAWLKDNLGGGAAPTANEDSGDGYEVGSLWVDVTNDKAYICLDATLTAAVWTEITQTGGGTGDTDIPPVAIPNGGSPLYVLPGLFIIETTTSTATADLLRYVPIWVGRTIHVEALVCEITTGNAAGRLARLGLYQVGAGLQPGALIVEGEVDLTTTGVKTVSYDQDLTQGAYLLAWNVNHATPAFRLHRFAQPGWVTTGTNNRLNSLNKTLSYAALTDPGTAWDTAQVAAATGQNAFVWLQVSTPA